MKRKTLLNKLKIIGHIVIYGFFYCLIFQALAYGQSSLDESIDCTKAPVEYINDPNLTREERIRRMDQAFYKSLNHFELCQIKNNESAAAGGDAGGSGGNSGVNGASGISGASSDQTDAGESNQESFASSSLSGTESAHENSGTKDIEMDNSDIHATSRPIDETNTVNGTQNTAANGKRPDDIPPSDNDNALAAQIRYAAEIEADPVKKAQLWNEYRKYKGLPLK